MNMKGFHSLFVALFITACLPSQTSTLTPAPTSTIQEVNTVTAVASPTTKSDIKIKPTATILSTTESKVKATAPASPSSTAADSHTYIPLVDLTASAPGGGIVADHAVLAQFSQIPRNAITAAAARKTLFMHQSTGGLIDDSGMGCLAGLHGDPEHYPQECVTYANSRATSSWPWYDKANLHWDFWPTPQADSIAKTDQFVELMRSRAANYQVIGMKYCYVDGWNQSENVGQNYYINKMLALESQYPNKIFIWATSALWHEPEAACGGLFDSCQQIAEFNQQIRAYAKAHNKPLFDIADIESHDRNGNPCKVGGYEGMCAEWYDGGGGHPNVAGSIRLAKGFWWLMARISGWNGL